MVIAPITWLRAVVGLRMRPAAHTASMRRTRISPVAASTPTSTKCAPNVDCWYLLSRSAIFHHVLGDVSAARACTGRGARRLDENPQAMRPRRETVEQPFGTL